VELHAGITQSRDILPQICSDVQLTWRNTDSPLCHRHRGDPGITSGFTRVHAHTCRNCKCTGKFTPDVGVRPFGRGTRNSVTCRATRSSVVDVRHRRAGSAGSRPAGVDPAPVNPVWRFHERNSFAHRDLPLRPVNIVMMRPTEEGTVVGVRRPTRGVFSSTWWDLAPGRRDRAPRDHTSHSAPERASTSPATRTRRAST
jgi:hypothetical protein